MHHLKITHCRRTGIAEDGIPEYEAEATYPLVEFLTTDALSEDNPKSLSLAIMSALVWLGQAGRIRHADLLHVTLSEYQQTSVEIYKKTKFTPEKYNITEQHYVSTFPGDEGFVFVVSPPY